MIISEATCHVIRKNLMFLPLCGKGLVGYRLFAKPGFALLPNLSTEFTLLKFVSLSTP